VRSIGWFLTNRTFGARIYLDDDQLLVWNQDDNEGNPFKARINVKEMRDAHEQGCIAAQNPFKETIVNQEDGIFSRQNILILHLKKIYSFFFIQR